VNHDAKCELRDPNRPTWVGPSCQCGSRAYPLCPGCRDGKHHAHATTNPGTGKTCACDLCTDQDAA
jgi:hypothetical protein